MTKKICSVCLKEKFLHKFNKHRGHFDGRYSQCKECRKADYLQKQEKYKKEALERYYKNRDKILTKKKEQNDPIKNRRNWLMRRYGLTDEDWNTIFQTQGGKCAICGIHQKDLDHIFRVDHNHITGQVRGLLCNGCNAGIGMLQVDSMKSSILLKAVDYINCPKEIDNG